MKRNIIIDTDTGSDDAVAIMMAIRSNLFDIKGITVVAGNVSLDQACINALVSVQQSTSDYISVFRGASKPLKKELINAQFAHGKNGMGDIELPPLTYGLEETQGVDAMLEMVKQYPNDIDIVAIGPLTNLALAIQKNPKTMKLVRSIYLMGGNGFGDGNITPYAEFNFYVDPDAAKIVYEFGVPIIALPWDACLDGTYVRDEAIDEIRSVGPLGEFAVDINKSLIDLSMTNYNINGFVLCDPGIIACMIDPEMILEQQSTYTSIITDGEEHGKEVIIEEMEPNTTIIKKMDYQKYVKLIKELLQ